MAMSRKLYPKEVEVECPWCGEVFKKVVQTKQDTERLHFCKNTDHKEVYNKHVRNKEEMKGLLCSKYYRAAVKKLREEKAANPEVKKEKKKVQPPVVQYPVRPPESEYTVMLRKHKMQSSCSISSFSVFPSNKRKTDWEDAND